MTGFLEMDTIGGKSIHEAAAFRSQHNIPYEMLSHNELCKRYPQLQFSSNYIGLLDKQAGMLMSDTCLKVLQVCPILQPSIFVLFF